ncbi:M23 family metallopeptidase [Luteithermobacter gelatinilyticus]|uniref:M23 family metallopeptidase n=1 Tax=Luteithermobacter gelatinilyticus TaxID=2582913 RepID=UPI0011069627|nr:M23 family metallopeptidase [Luteithermobacter gelatinilyticus]
MLIFQEGLFKLPSMTGATEKFICKKLIGVRVIREKYIRVAGTAAVCLVLLAGCQEGHPYQIGYKNSLPGRVAKNSPYPIPVPRSKPTPPRQFAAVPRRHKTSVVQGASVTVRKGDTVYAISRRHKVTVRDLITVNRLRPPYLLRPGQKLLLPVAGRHIVRKGDTVYSISRRYKVDMTELVRLNRLKKPYILHVGQVLNVPGGNRAGGTQAAARVAIPTPPPSSGQGFLWPVKGQIISRFGPKANGYHNDGINILAPPGAAVRAAESGVVVYADNKLKGYGNLVLIQHEGGWISAYAHNKTLLVRKGQKVVRGQTIAKVGQSGRVTRPQLHFELRKGSRAVNPERYLKT